jgi:thiamine biosynthesis lipoprotein
VAVPEAITGEPPALGQPVHRLSGTTMGTTWSVALVGPPGLRLAAIDAAVQRVCNEVIAEMSQWTPDSILSQFNRAASGSEHLLPEGFARVLSAALQIAELSGGAYDPTAGELVGLWGFGPASLTGSRDGGSEPSPGSTPSASASASANPVTGPGAWLRHEDPHFRLPTPEQCAQAHCGWQSLGWDPQRRVLTQPGRATLDLSAIAKGDAVDRLSDLLTGLGLPHHLVEVGGELRGAGLKPQGQPWWVDLEPPHASAALPPLRVALHGLSIATSGDYRKTYQDAQGRRVSHTVDPRQRRPVSHGLASVTVLHPSAMWADGWSTALMVLGPEEGLRLAEQQHLAARLVVRRPSGGFDESFSSALQALLM